MRQGEGEREREMGERREISFPLSHLSLPLFLPLSFLSRERDRERREKERGGRQTGRLKLIIFQLIFLKSDI